MAARHRTLLTSAALAVTALIGVPVAAAAADTPPAPTASVRVAAPLAAAQARTAAKVQAQNRVRARIVSLARSKVGDRYVSGASGPHRFDCSGLAKYVYAHAAHKSLPHYSRAQFTKLRHVSKSQRKPGDLVFFFRHGMQHVGIYVGGGRMINAQSPRSGVRVATLSAHWIAPHYSGAGSVF